ncbi:50S ribosomal protein L35 [Candidatus Gottesmanbacteria bacterium RIFCSPLOWO2_01_FULL_43_11b]|uniref:Large ribosomal subunit protein bL35 n=1 Tax=Candidatus Gottesmanbacteria bacterium RIFCSPLOWO2_01_FULL_43_11b TaxID=1798392 RepID=A0A1F6AHB7_9BACT|nr:MAG: 50S ribosomal protein L35 [Candidatus Gottesmanbacteria bacterium RIFCSPLOWO2_01_FULL_43_11b]
MMKVKTKKIVSKRFKVTGTGKIMHRVQGARHLRRKKSKRRQRRQDKMVQVTTRAFERNIARFLDV